MQYNPAPPDAAPDSLPGPTAEVAPPGDSTPRPLDPRWLALTRTVSTISGAVMAMAHGVAALGLWVTHGAPLALIVSLAWIPITGLLVWQAVAWPRIEYRHWRYRVGPDGIQIWSGVVWRTAVTVPRSRIQHIDVSQGPLERSYGLATLSVFTAGTEFSRVNLPGLDHGIAMTVRDALLPKDAETAV